MDRTCPFLDKIYREDIFPCLTFSKSEVNSLHVATDTFSLNMFHEGSWLLKSHHIKLYHLCSIRVWQFLVQYRRLFWSIEVNFFSICYSRCGCLRWRLPTLLDVNAVWQNQCLQEWMVGFPPVCQRYCLGETVSCRCPLFIEGALESNIANFVALFSLS